MKPFKWVKCVNLEQPLLFTLLLQVNHVQTFERILVLPFVSKINTMLQAIPLGTLVGSTKTMKSIKEMIN